jgi:hypothetical protein
MNKLIGILLYVCAYIYWLHWLHECGCNELRTGYATGYRLVTREDWLRGLFGPPFRFFPCATCTHVVHGSAIVRTESFVRSRGQQWFVAVLTSSDGTYFNPT